MIGQLIFTNEIAGECNTINKQLHYGNNSNRRIELRVIIMHSVYTRSIQTFCQNTFGLFPSKKICTSVSSQMIITL